METVRRAVIDVGTNSVKLLVADVLEQNAEPIHEESRQTRLGKKFYDAHRLQPDAIEQTAEAVQKFSEIAREKKSRSIRVIATSAARDAVNKDELIWAIARASGLKVEIISGEQEAAWAFQGVTANSDLAKTPLLLLDVGGGSTEFILGCGNKKHFAESFPLGAVRLMEKFPFSDPPTETEFLKCRDWIKSFLRNEVAPKLQPTLKNENSRVIQIIATGGTATILARMELKLEHFDRAQIESARLNLEQIKSCRQNLWRLPMAQRKEIVGLPKSRADVILTGVLIYESAMEEFGFDTLRVSTRGLRFAALTN